MIDANRSSGVNTIGDVTFRKLRKPHRALLAGNPTRHNPREALPDDPHRAGLFVSGLFQMAIRQPKRPQRELMTLGPS
jgi:hypothetical protein